MDETPARTIEQILDDSKFLRHGAPEHICITGTPMVPVHYQTLRTLLDFVADNIELARAIRRIAS